MLVLEERTFALKISCFESSDALVFVNGVQDVTQGEVLSDLPALVHFSGRVHIGRIRENGSNLTLLEGCHRFIDAVLRSIERTNASLDG
jgi:hypothetical protein